MLEFSGREDADQLPRFQQRDACAQQQGFAHVVGHEDNGLLQAQLERLKLALDFRPRQRVERPEGLVHQQERRVTRQGPRHSHALPLPAGKLTRVARKKLFRGQANQFKHLPHPPADSLGRPAFQLRHQAHVAFHREVREESCFLDAITDASAQANGVPRERRTPFHLDFARARFQHVGDKLERGSFTGPAAAEQHEGFAAAHAKAHVRKEQVRICRAERHAAKLNDGFGHFAHRSAKPLFPYLPMLPGGQSVFLDAQGPIPTSSWTCRSVDSAIVQALSAPR